MALEVIQGIDSYFTFRIGGVLFAINVGNVSGIVEMMSITEVPNTPDYLMGIINLEGEVLPVFDGRLKLGFEPVEYSQNSIILVLILELENQSVGAGVIVDSVEKVLKIESDAIEPANSIETGFNPLFIYGISDLNDESIIILDLEKIFSEVEISKIDTV